MPFYMIHIVLVFSVVGLLTVVALLLLLAPEEILAQGQAADTTQAVMSDTTELVGADTTRAAPADSMAAASSLAVPVDSAGVDSATHAHRDSGQLFFREAPKP